MTMNKMLAALAGSLTLILGPQAASAQTAAGDWVGALTINPALNLRVAVHIRKTSQGVYAGTVDSPDQGNFDKPLSDIAVVAGALSFSDATLSARYEGKWDPAARQWVGQWTQSGQPARALNLAPGVFPPAPAVAGLDGDWDGALEASLGVKLRLALHIKSGAHGTLATLDSIDQGANGIAVSAISRTGDHVRIEMKLLGAVADGDLADGGQTLKTSFTQSGVVMPLTLTRRAAGQKEAALNRPQTPVKPYPYPEEEVAYDNPAAHVRLAGTLTLPKGDGPFPVVVLVAGSGPNTRDEPLMGHRPFLVLADHLTRQGIAVLRYDKRGTGASTGDFAKATTMDFADDVQAGMAYLKHRKDIDPRRIGLIGHSEGGLIVPIVAARDPSTAFIVMMAGPGVNGADILMEQGRLMSKAGGMSDARIEETSNLRGRMIAIVRQEKDPATAAAKLREAMAAQAKAQGLPDSAVETQISQINSDWFRFFFSYDPAPILRKVRCPVLAISGSKDLQVPPDQNLPAIRAALAGNPDAEIDELPNLNHLFQTAKTGGLGEYAQIEETIAPVALDTMTGWILKQIRR